MSYTIDTQESRRLQIAMNRNEAFVKVVADEVVKATAARDASTSDDAKAAALAELAILASDDDAEKKIGKLTATRAVAAKAAADAQAAADVVAAKVAAREKLDAARAAFEAARAEAEASA